MDTCLVTDFDKLCRICMKIDKTFLPINSFNIIDMIITCASVQIWENDDLPNQICHACFVQLQNTKSFKDLCENSDTAFRQIIQKNKINLPNNKNDFEIKKDEEFEDYDADFSVDIKEEEDTQNIINDDDKITVDYKNQKTNILEIQTEEGDPNDNLKNNENVIEKFTCTKCNKEFKKLWVLGQHMHLKHRAKAIKCNKCQFKYYHQLHFNQHQELMHNPLNLTCNICSKVFKNIYKLKEHKLRHSSESLHCQRCDILFTDKRTLKSHNKEMHPHLEKYVACHVCGKTITKHSLKAHLETHKERDKLTCDICLKTFIRPDTLTNHIKLIHGNQKPSRDYLCNICGHAMRTAKELRVHFLIHTKERPYACEHCDKTYRREDNLKEHISHVHLNQRKYQCNFCPQAFYNHRILTNHVRRHTGEKPHKCEVCGKRFIQKIALKIHMKIHTNSIEKLS